MAEYSSHRLRYPTTGLNPRQFQLLQSLIPVWPHYERAVDTLRHKGPPDVRRQTRILSVYTVFQLSGDLLNSADGKVSIMPTVVQLLELAQKIRPYVSERERKRILDDLDGLNRIARKWEKLHGCG